MKLAMAVGDNRHYTIDSIMPQHFLQTAASCGVPASLVQAVLDGSKTIRIAPLAPQ
ncbi:MAG TPA: hypothetical protein VGG62_02705 [Terracidiphilus sp.]|jgi:serine/threonine-protein kinase HipA